MVSVNASSVISFSSFLYKEPRPTERWDGAHSVGSVGDGVTLHSGPVGVLVNVHHIVGGSRGGEVLSDHVVGDGSNVIVVHLVERGNNVEHDDVVPGAAASDDVHDFLFSLCQCRRSSVTILV